MIKKFTEFIVEAGGNIYQKGTPFSNGHRSRKNGNGFLLDRHLMIDLDEIIIDSSGSIVALVEKKMQLPGPKSAFQNILDPSVKSPQKMALLELSRRLNCKLFIHVDSTKEYHLIKSDYTTKTYPESLMDSTMKDKNLKIVQTDNLIFLEFRIQYGRILLKAIVERISSSNSVIFGYVDQISEKCGGLTKIQVDDERSEMIFRQNGRFIGKVDSILYPNTITGEQRSRIESKWEEIYTQLGVFD